MAHELINATIVVVAQDHNPSILHPSFLTANGVMPTGLELAGPPICTPAFARVLYANGISFQAEPDRINISDGRLPEDATQSSLPVYATKYVELLPHVPYRAVGINFTGLVLDEQPAHTIIRTFLRDGPWNAEGFRAQELGLKFTYEASPGTLSLSIDPGTVRKAADGSTVSGILVAANYHADVTNAENALGETLGFVRLFADRCRDYHQKVKRIFES